MGRKARMKRDPWRKLMKQLGLRPDTHILFTDSETCRNVEAQEPMTLAALDRIIEQARAANQGG